MSAIPTGGTVAIATGTPATFDKAGYEALTWVVISGPIEAPTSATTHADIAIPSLGGRTKIRKGAETGVASPLSWEEVADDPGQAAVIAACLARGEYSISYTDPDDVNVTYSSGVLKDYAPNAPTNSSYRGGTCQFVPNYNAITVATPT